MSEVNYLKEIGIPIGLTLFSIILGSGLALAVKDLPQYLSELKEKKFNQDYSFNK